MNQDPKRITGVKRSQPDYVVADGYKICDSCGDLYPLDDVVEMADETKCMCVICYHFAFC